LPDEETLGAQAGFGQEGVGGAEHFARSTVRGETEAPVAPKRVGTRFPARRQKLGLAAFLAFGTHLFAYGFSLGPAARRLDRMSSVARSPAVGSSRVGRRKERPGDRAGFGQVDVRIAGWLLIAIVSGH
jgi:hypothetical protein